MVGYLSDAPLGRPPTTAQGGIFWRNQALVASPTPPVVNEGSPQRRAKLYRTLVARLTEILPGGGELEFALANAQRASCSELRRVSLYNDHGLGR